VALQYLQFRPGLSRESTNLANSGGFYAGDKIRFKSGLPQKLGGWVNYGPSNIDYLGVCRSLTEFVSLTNYYILGLGTNLKYYLLIGNVYYDITPLRAVDTLPANPFYPIYGALGASASATDTTLTVSSGTAFTRCYPYVITIGTEKILVNGASGTSLTGCLRGYEGTTAAAHSSGATITSTMVAVSDNVNGANAGDFVTFFNATAFGPYSAALLDSNYQLFSVNGNYVIIDTGVESTSTANGGGSYPVTAAYEIYTGADIVYSTLGWGAGPWGRPSWNTGYSGTAATTFAGAIRLWSGDNFGANLITNPRNGAIYYWDSSLYLDSSGMVVGTPSNPEGRSEDMKYLALADGYCPAVAAHVLVTDQRHVVALGAMNDPLDPNGTVQDPMMIQWCSQEDIYTWNPTDVTNTAGYQRLTYGSKIITAEKTRQEVLVFTDSAVYSMQYLGAPYVFGFNPISVEITLVSPNAVITSNNITYWMGQDKFYVYSGRVDTLPCSLRQYIFDDINAQQFPQVCAGTNEKYNEIWWFYPSANSDYNDRYVIYNYLERLWYYGTMPRSAWLDSHIIGNPVAAVDGMIVQHETGLDDGTTNPPSPIYSYIQSADFDLGEGDKFSCVKRMVPDVDFIGSNVVENPTPSVNITISTRNFPGQGDYVKETTSNVPGQQVTTQVYNYTNQVFLRLRGRQVAFKIESEDLGVAWQMGTCRLDVVPDGTRSA